MRVFITKEIPTIAKELLISYGHTVTVGKKNQSAQELLEQAKASDALITMLSDPIDADFLTRCPQLKVIANYAVGYNNIDLTQAKRLNIRVGNTPGVLTNATADLALTLLMSASRQLIAAYHNVVNQEWENWEPKGFLGIELKGKTLGILGAGRIGQAFAHKCYHALGMNIIYHSTHQKLDFEKKYSAHYCTLDELIQTSDVLSLHAPLTEQTNGLMKKEQFFQMKKNSIFINTARGQMHDELALLEAINQNHLFAAGLDVTTIEPLPPESPLRSHPRILILPHIGSATIETREDMAKLCVENIQAAFTNSTMPAEVTA